MVSGTLSLPYYGCFSPFPHGTGTLSVSHEYLALPDGPGHFTQDSSCPALLRIPIGFMSLRILGFHRLRRHFPEASARDTSCHVLVLQPQGGRNLPGLGCSPVARHYWGNHVLFSLPQGTKMFQFPWFASIPRWMTVLQTAGLSHSEICGSKAICAYPQLIAACHVLLRL